MNWLLFHKLCLFFIIFRFKSGLHLLLEFISIRGLNFYLPLILFNKWSHLNIHDWLLLDLAFCVSLRLLWFIDVFMILNNIIFIFKLVNLLNKSPEISAVTWSYLRLICYLILIISIFHVWNIFYCLFELLIFTLFILW